MELRKANKRLNTISGESKLKLTIVSYFYGDSLEMFFFFFFRGINNESLIIMAVTKHNYFWV